VKVDPTQLPSATDPVGVTVYVAVVTALVVLVSVPPMLAPLPAAPPLNPAPAGAPQLYVVPAGTMPLAPFAGVTEKAVPPHTVAVMFDTCGRGFNVTVTVKVEPTQLPSATDPVGVTVYVAVVTALVVLVSVPPMLAPLPAAPPLKPAPAGAPQLYVVPAGTMPSVPFAGVTEKAIPPQTVVVIFVT